METSMKQGGRIGMVWPGMAHGPTSVALTSALPADTIMVGKGVWAELREQLASEGAARPPAPGHTVWIRGVPYVPLSAYGKLPEALPGTGTWHTGLPGQRAPQAT